jgi:hypothetical protein
MVIIIHYSEVYIIIIYSGSSMKKMAVIRIRSQSSISMLSFLFII